MNNFNISVFNNQIFFEILSELKLFSKCNIKHYEDPDLCKKDAEKSNGLVVFFDNSFDKIKTSNFPSILITEPVIYAA